MDLDGKTALVTGGAAGIGAGIAERLAAEGTDVVIADLDRAAGATTADRIGGSFVRADVATAAGVRTAVDAAFRSTGLLDVLVSNAGGVEEPARVRRRGATARARRRWPGARPRTGPR